MRNIYFVGLLFASCVTDLHAQTVEVNWINRLLDTTEVEVSTLEISFGSKYDLKPYTPLFYEYSAVDKQYDSVSHGFAQLKLGSIVKCDSVVVTKKLASIYLAGKEQYQGYYMPVDLLIAAKHREKEFLHELLFKLSYLLNKPVTSIVLYTDVNSVFRDAYDLPAGVKTFNRARYAFLFYGEVSIAEVKKASFTIDSLRAHSERLYSFANVYYPRAMLIHESDVYINRGPSKKERREYILAVKKSIERFMEVKFRKRFGNKFVSDGQHKFTFKSVQGEITKQATNWEFYDIAITYTPYDEESGQLIFNFEGRYKQASDKGKGPSDPIIIRTDGKPIEDFYANEVHAYLSNLSKEIEQHLKHERK